MTASRRKGTRAETGVVEYLRTRGWRYAERRALNGAKDRGDIAGIPGVVIEVKNASRLELAEWVKEARVEALNDKAPVWFVCAKPNGRGNPADWYAITTLKVMCDLLADEPAAEVAS